MQRTPAWFAARAKKITASNIGACLGLVSYTTRKEAYLRAVSSGNADETEPATVNEACMYGIKHEPIAIKCYQHETGNSVKEAGFVTHPTYNWIGASPDGYIGNEGMLEVKCPFFHKVPHHKIPLHYYLQMIFQLECTQRKWCDFYSWTPDATTTFRVLPDTDLFDWLLNQYLFNLHEDIEANKGEFRNMKSGEKIWLRCRIQESMDTHVVGNQRTISDMFRMPCPERDPFDTFSNDEVEDGSNDIQSDSTMEPVGETSRKSQRTSY